MGFDKVVKPEVHPPCPLPLITRHHYTLVPDFGPGRAWKCDRCGPLYELISIPARGDKVKWELIEG